MLLHGTRGKERGYDFQLVPAMQGLLAGLAWMQFSGGGSRGYK